MAKGSIPVDDSYKPVVGLWDDSGHQVVGARAKNVGTDSSTGDKYGDLGVNVEVSVSPTSNQRINTQAGDIVSGSAVAGAFADGAITTIGLEADAAWTSGSGTLVSLLKALFTKVLSIGRSTVAVYSLASTATTSSSNSGDLTVGPYTEISIDINITAKTGTNPTIQFTYSRKGADGVYYALWQTSLLTNTATQVYTASIGAGMQYNSSLGATGQLSWVIGGSATPGYTFSANIQGK